MDFLHARQPLVAHDGSRRDGRMPNQDRLDRRGVGLVAIDHDQVREPVHQVEIAVVVESAEVTGVQPAAAQRLGRRVGAAQVAGHDRRAVDDDLAHLTGGKGPVVWNGYGQGESPCTITAHSKAAIAAAVEADDEERLASVGVARLATRVRVDAEPGEVGEVLVDGPTVMAGYLDMPEESAETLRDGWLHTGDLGRFDENGYLTLVDRAKDVVITGGYNVYPREVEDVLIADPAVSDVAVIGVPDDEWARRRSLGSTGAAPTMIVPMRSGSSPMRRSSVGGTKNVERSPRATRSASSSNVPSTCAAPRPMNGSDISPDA